MVVAYVRTLVLTRRSGALRKPFLNILAAGSCFAAPYLAQRPNQPLVLPLRRSPMAIFTTTRALPITGWSASVLRCLGTAISDPPIG